MSILVILPQFPNVPQVPGVPPLPRSLSFPTPDAPPLASADATGVDAPSQSAAPKWGIFDSNNNLVITADTVVGFDFKREFRIADYPIEDGGFETYNKVAVPYEPRFTMAKGGTVAERTAFITAIENAIGNQANGPNLSLYNVVTPEYTWTNANLYHWDIHRTSEKGVSLLTAEIWLREIRVAPGPAFSKTQQPSGQTPSSDGMVAAADPTPVQMSAADAQSLQRTSVPDGG